jgi:glycosyltransferase 2 family protein
MKLSRWIQFAAGMAIAAAGLWIFFKDVSLQRLGNELASCHPVPVALSFVLAVLTLWLRAARWSIMLPRPHGSHRKGLFPITMIGFMVNNILPARAGEAVRILLLWKKNRYNAATAIGSLVLERGIDTVVFILFFCVPIFVLLPTSHLSSAAVSLAAIFVVCLAGFALYAMFPLFVKRLCLRATAILPGKLQARAQALITDVTSNLDWLSSIRRTAAVAVLSCLIPLCYVGMVVALVWDVHVLGLLQGMFAIALAALGAAVPLAPGYVGTLHAAMKFGFVTMGLGEDRAAALAILYHAIGYIPVTALGLYYFFRTDMRFRDLSEARSSVDQLDAKGP